MTESNHRSVVLPLAGVKIVDFTANAAGPAATMLLADFGAEVVKIEPPGGDSTRFWGAARFGESSDLTPTFMAMNRNKASVVLDLKSASGIETALALIDTADVVVESFAPGTADRLGIGYEHLKERRPGLIYCSVSGFGQTGPLSARPGFDMLMQAYCGHMSITGAPGQPSVRIGPSAIDLVTGAHAAFGVLVALRHRDATGEGQRIDAALFDAAVYLVGNHLTDCIATGVDAAKFGSQFPLMAPYGIFAAADREFYLGVSSDAMWRRFADAAGLEIASDPRFATNAGRLQNRAELDGLLVSVFPARTADHWVELAVSLGIPASLLHTLAEVARHEHTAARELLVDAGVAGIQTVGVPLKLSATPGLARRPAPTADQDHHLVSADPVPGAVS